MSKLDQRMERRQRESSGQSERKKKQRRLITVLVLLTLACGCDLSGESDRQTEARRFAKRCIKEKLIAPGTADFGSTLDESDLTLDELEDAEGTYLVYGWVDSHNQTGAMVRTQIVGKVRLRNDGTRQLVYLEMSGAGIPGSRGVWGTDRLRE